MPRLLEEMGGMKQRLDMWKEGHTRMANVLQKGAKSRGQQDTERRERVDEKIAKIKKAREDLNPYDEMDIDTKKKHARQGSDCEPWQI